MKVLAERCATCIFRPGNLMELRPGRVKGMVDDCKRSDGYIPCHETMVYEDRWADDEADSDFAVTPDSPVCRGFYDTYPRVSIAVRVAQALGELKEVGIAEAKEARDAAQRVLQVVREDAPGERHQHPVAPDGDA